MSTDGNPTKKRRARPKSKRAKLAKEENAPTTSLPNHKHDGRKESSNGNHVHATNEALSLYRKLRKSWPKDMPRLFDPSISDGRRAELWELLCERGDILRQRSDCMLLLYLCPSFMSTSAHLAPVFAEVPVLQKVRILHCCEGSQIIGRVRETTTITGR